MIRSRPSLAGRRSRTGRAGRTPSGDARVNAPTRYARAAHVGRAAQMHESRAELCKIKLPLPNWVCRRRDLLAPTAADVCGDAAGSAWRRCGCSRRCVAPHDGHAPAGVPTSRRRRGGNVMVPLPAPAPRRGRSSTRINRLVPHAQRFGVDGGRVSTFAEGSRDVPMTRRTRLIVRLHWLLKSVWFGVVPCARTGGKTTTSAYASGDARQRLGQPRCRSLSW